MSSLGIVLVLFSAVLHASWNTYSKSFGSPLSFIYRALACSAAIYAPLFICALVVAPFTATVWGLVLLSGALSGTYYITLALAYRDGHISVAYPVARAFPILVITWAGMFLGERPSIHGVGGVLLVVLGCFFLPFQRFGCGGNEQFWKAYLTRSTFWALLTALITSLFSIVDKLAAVRTAAEFPWQTVVAKLNYVYVQNLISLGILVVFCRLSGMKTHKIPRIPAIVFGVVFLLSYGLVMAALATDPVAYVVAFRQVSIVMATIASMLFIEKRFSWPRLTGAMMITAGVVLVALG